MTDEDYSLNDSAADVIISDFLKRNDDLEIDLVIRYLPDLGYQAALLSGGTQMVLSGHTESPSLALIRLVTKAEPKIAEHREYKAKIEAAFAADLEDDED